LCNFYNRAVDAIETKLYSFSSLNAKLLNIRQALIQIFKEVQMVYWGSKGGLGDYRNSLLMQFHVCITALHRSVTIGIGS